MNELYEAIEKKIKDAGYPRNISGADVYDDICDQIDGKENGEYLLLSHFEEGVIFEYHIFLFPLYNQEQTLYALHATHYSAMPPHVYPILFPKK